MKRFNEFARFMGHVGDLKKLERTGWVRSGIQNPESVADHSFRTTIMALVLADKAGVDQNKVVKMALVHELAESVVGDLTPTDGVSAEDKHHLEINAFKKLCADIDNGDELLELFQEFEDNKTPEAQFVKSLDKLEMMFQAHEYGLEQPNIDLQSFWDYIQGFDFGDLKEVYDSLEINHNKKKLIFKV